jgi:hypothetical protein
MFLMAAVGCGCRPLRFLLGLSNRSSQSAHDRSIVVPSVPLENDKNLQRTPQPIWFYGKSLRTKKKTRKMTAAKKMTTAMKVTRSKGFRVG